MRWRHTVLVLAMAACWAPDLCAQPTGGVLPADTVHYSTGRLASAGVVGGIVGFVAGGFVVGSALAGVTDCEGDGLCGLGNFLYGGLFGESLGLAAGIHLANGRRGKWHHAAAASLAVAALGVGVAAALDEPAVLLAVPVGQLMAGIAAERSSAR